MKGLLRRIWELEQVISDADAWDTVPNIWLSHHHYDLPLETDLSVHEEGCRWHYVCDRCACGCGTCKTKRPVWLLSILKRHRPE